MVGEVAGDGVFEVLGKVAKRVVVALIWSDGGSAQIRQKKYLEAVDEAEQQNAFHRVEFQEFCR